MSYIAKINNLFHFSVFFKVIDHSVFVMDFKHDLPV